MSVQTYHHLSHSTTPSPRGRVTRPRLTNPKTQARPQRSLGTRIGKSFYFFYYPTNYALAIDHLVPGTRGAASPPFRPPAPYPTPFAHPDKDVGRGGTVVETAPTTRRPTQTRRGWVTPPGDEDEGGTRNPPPYRG